MAISNDDHNFLNKLEETTKRLSAIKADHSKQGELEALLNQLCDDEGLAPYLPQTLLADMKFKLEEIKQG